MHDIHTQQEIESGKLFNLALFLIISLSIFLLISLYVSRGIRIYHDKQTIANKPSVFTNVSLEAKAAIVYDIQNKKVLFEKDAYTPLPLASITKVMTVVTAQELLPKGTVVTIHKEFLKEEGDSGFRVDEKWDLRDLIDFSLISSSNDGAAAIAAAAGAAIKNAPVIDQTTFIAEMNRKAKNIGMEHASFYNVTGLDMEEGNNGGYASARDIATLFEYTLRTYPEIFEATRLQDFSTHSLNAIYHKASNTNPDISITPNILGSKTGFTDIAGGNLAIVFDAGINRPIVVVVLGSSAEGRFSDVQTLISKSLKEINQD